MEGVAYALYDSFSVIRDSGQAIQGPIVLNEGGARSVLWRRIITDVFNTPTVMVKNRTGAPYGDAILAGVATGVFDDLSVAREWVELAEPMEPDPGRARRGTRSTSSCTGGSTGTSRTTSATSRPSGVGVGDDGRRSLERGRSGWSS